MKTLHVLLFVSRTYVLSICIPSHFLFQSLKHDHKVEEENKIRMNQLKSTIQLMKKDGFSNLKYKLNQKAEHQHYTHVYVDLLYQEDQNWDKLRSLL